VHLPARMDRSCNRLLDEDAVSQFRGAAVAAVSAGARAYGEAHGLKPAVRDELTECDMRTAVTTVWLSDVGPVKIFAEPQAYIERALRDAGVECDLEFGEDYCRLETALTKRAVVRPKGCSVERMRSAALQQQQQQPRADARAARGGERRRVFALLVLFALVALVAAAVIGPLVYVGSLRTMLRGRLYANISSSGDPAR